MPMPDENDRAAEAPSPAWRVTVLDHREVVGTPPYESRFTEGEPLAHRGGLRIHGALGEVTCIDEDGRTRWRHRLDGRPNAAHVSGDRVLVTTDSMEYTPWGNLGPALLLDLADGTRVTELRGARGASLRGGRFLLGLEGYDFFDTWEYDRDGNRVDAWRSYGHYVVGTGVRVVECDRSFPTESRVVRLLRGGVVERGPRLTDPTVPRPVVLEDGTVLVLDSGVLRAVGRRLDDAVLTELLPLDPRNSPGYYGTLHRTGDRLTATVSLRTPPEDHTRYTVHTWTLALHRPA
ncbi:hypothetical protein [Kitasatospora sp. NPDC051914]|uniref:hypothetical protein n=1 Tax=Kitasatospora sp. NPDC051914 TaxID=3154945 RepID=UPI0034499A8D